MAWRVYRAFAAERQEATRLAAMNSVDRPYRAGRVTIVDERSGESWERRSGSWVKTAEPDAARVRRHGMRLAQHGEDAARPVRPQDVRRP